MQKIKNICALFISERRKYFVLNVRSIASIKRKRTVDGRGSGATAAAAVWTLWQVCQCYRPNSRDLDYVYLLQTYILLALHAETFDLCRRLRICIDLLIHDVIRGRFYCRLWRIWVVYGRHRAVLLRRRSPGGGVGEGGTSMCSVPDVLIRRQWRRPRPRHEQKLKERDNAMKYKTLKVLLYSKNHIRNRSFFMPHPKTFDSTY